MYARYVPSAASAAPAEPASRSPAPVDAEPAGAATMAAPTSYARYMPGAGNGSNITPDASYDIDDRPAKKARQSPQPAKHTKTKSKKRTSKRRTSAVDSDAEESSTSSDDESDRKNDRVSQEPVVEVEEDEEQSSPTPVEIQAAPKKPKREKKSKKSMNTEAQSDDDADDKVEKRHRAVFERKRKSMQAPTLVDATPKDGEDATMEDAPSPEEAHGLEPLPQPKPAELDDTVPTFETLPLWLAEPIRVSPQAVADFDKLGSSPELGISSVVTAKLASVGYKNAFAIQTAVIPLLLPHHCNSQQGDVLVSAATGSGKTLSYALPMIRDLSYGNRRLTRLRALIVLPTRELVKQAQQVCEEIAGVFAIDGARRRVRVGVSMGSQNLEKEQSAFVEREETYDPEAYAARTRRLAAGEYDQDADATDDEERADRSRQEDRIPTLPDHVIQYKSKIDVLICTPGRLVEHIKYTPGFSLDYVRWLVVDEADKLLGQDFQQWLDVVIPPLHQDPNSQKRNHHHSNLSGVRKVILSATMTRDLERLGGLKLRRPSLVVLEGAAGTENDVDMSRAEHALPELLEEAALKVSDPNVKPVFLVDLLRSKKILGNAAGEAPALPRGEADDTSSSESEADTSSEEEEEDDESSSSDSEVESDKSSSPQPKHNQSSSSPSVLIFTKSNETAMRLSRLLSLISPKLAPLLGTLTSTTAYSSRRQTLRDFTAGKLRVLVASDLVARGIDLPSLDHVINYDMPTSVASYVHRVGRTARASKSGKAWTLFTKPEARWFWTEIAGAKMITRVKEVQRVRVTEEKEALFDEKVKVYETALETLGQEAGEMRRRGRA